MPELYKIIHNLVIFFLEEGRATLIVQKKYTHTHIYVCVCVYKICISFPIQKIPPEIYWVWKLVLYVEHIYMTETVFCLMFSGGAIMKKLIDLYLRLRKYLH